MLSGFCPRRVVNLYRAFGVLVLFGGVFACTTFSPPTETVEQSPSLETQPQPVVAAPEPPADPPPPDLLLSLEEAVLYVTRILFTQIRLPAAEKQTEGKHLLVIDPLLDGISGIQSSATRLLESRIVDVIQATYPQFSLQPFSAANLRKSPVVLIGTFNAINKQGHATGQREPYRFCLALADLKSRTIVAKGAARVQPQGVDHTPTPYFRDSPTWMKEGVITAYINSCQDSNVGDLIQPDYLDGIMAATAINQAISAYDNGQYAEAAELYASALEMPAGNQLRVYNGLYLTNLKLGRKNAANEAFGKIIEHGWANKRLAVKFFFKPGTTTFSTDGKTSSAYPYWLKEIAKRAAKSNSCLEITGHSSRTGPEPLNERLSQQRAEYIKKRLVAEAPKLNGRTIASGAGSREILIGTGKDDVTDALDRRVVFQVHPC
jgi:outer membrane protein OmpA-like peptidoglycan-associated protein